jgi:hypothetical protein
MEFSTPESAVPLHLSSGTLYKSNLKGKVVSVIIKHDSMKTYGGVEASFQVFIISEQDGGDWSASRSGNLYTGERAYSDNRI